VVALSKSKIEKKIDPLKELLKNISALKEKDIEKYVEIIKELLKNNEAIFIYPGIVKIKRKVIQKYNRNFIDKEEEVSSVINDIFLICYLTIKGHDSFPEIKTDDKVQIIIKKLKEHNIFETICARFYIENNYFIDAKYNLIKRDYPIAPNKCTIKTSEFIIHYRDVNEEEKKIILELDLVQLKYLQKLIENAINDYMEND